MSGRTFLVLNLDIKSCGSSRSSCWLVLAKQPPAPDRPMIRIPTAAASLLDTRRVGEGAEGGGSTSTARTARLRRASTNLVDSSTSTVRQEQMRVHRLSASFLRSIFARARLENRTTLYVGMGIYVGRRSRRPRPPPKLETLGWLSPKFRHRATTPIPSVSTESSILHSILSPIPPCFLRATLVLRLPQF